MLVLLTAWVVHNWWKILIGIAMAIAVLEYHHQRRKREEQGEPGDDKTET